VESLKHILAKRKCPFQAGCPIQNRRPVRVDGPEDAYILLVGEAPGYHEERKGYPFVGKAGQELDGLYLKQCAGVSRDKVRVSNTVKCRPSDKDDTPSQAAINYCTEHYLRQEVLEGQHEYIGALGAVATRYLLGRDVSMDQVHGQVFRSTWHDKLVMPLFHPAYGLHNTAKMRYIMEDFEAFGRMIRGQSKEVVPCADAVDYGLDWDEGEIGPIVGLDTESAGTCIWSIQVSPRPTRAFMIMADDKEGIARLRRIFREKNPLVVMHNVPFDLRMLNQVDIYPDRYTDTMSMAYHLGLNAKGLKTLAWRYCSMVMQSYSEVVAGASEEKALEYVGGILDHDWPDPEPETYIKDGEMKIKYPQNIKKRVGQWLKKYAAGTAKGTVREYWLDKKKAEDREMVEAVLGRMPVGYLSDVAIQDAIQYACTDADATLRIYPILQQLVEENDLSGVVDRDIRLMPMVIEMENTGMLVDPTILDELEELLTDSLDDVRGKLHDMAGEWVNPNSTQQVAKFLVSRGVFSNPKMSTGAEILDRYTDHEEVQLIQKYRELLKLKSTYIIPLKRYRDKSGRIHTDISMTRTETGRLASCLPVWETVITKRGRLNITAVEIGDSVIDHKGKLQKVTNVFFSGESDIYRVILSNGNFVMCTSNHRLLTTKGWLSLEDIYEHQQKTHEGHGVVQQDSEHVPDSRETHNGGGCCDDGYYISHNSSCSKEGPDNRGSADGEGIEGLQEGETGIGALSIREDSGAASQLQGCNRGRARVSTDAETRVVYGEGGKQVRVPTSCGDVQSNEYNGNSQGIFSSSHKWGQNQQRDGEPCIGIGCWSPENTPLFSDIREVEYVGFTRVYDLEVEGEHSFLTGGGVFVHNSNPNLMNIPVRTELGRRIRNAFVSELEG